MAASTEYSRMMPSQFWASLSENWQLSLCSPRAEPPHKMSAQSAGRALSLHGEGRGLAESSRPAISTVTVLTPTLSPDLSPLYMEYPSVLPRLENSN